MKKPELSIFNPSNGLTAEALAEQVLSQGFVIFDASRPFAKDLKNAAIDLLDAGGVEVEYGISHWTYYTHFLIDTKYGYDAEEFSQWVTELCEKNHSSHDPS